MIDIHRRHRILWIPGVNAWRSAWMCFSFCHRKPGCGMWRFWVIVAIPLSNLGTFLWQIYERFFGCYCGWFSDIFRHPNPQLIGGKPGKDSTIYRISTCFNHPFAGAGNRQLSIGEIRAGQVDSDWISRGNPFLRGKLQVYNIEKS